jgi:ADP-ribose pyrophosphatase
MKSSNREAEIHSIQKHYQGKLFSFVSEDVTLPNGSRAEMAMVRHPGSTAVVPLLDEDTVVMERQYRHAIKDYLLEIPAGTMEPGEQPLDCARRELEEETGYRAKRMIELGPIHILPSYTDEVTHVYIARELRPARQSLDKDEILEVVHFPLEQTLKMISDGRITDALTVLSLQNAWFYLNNGGR